VAVPNVYWYRLEDLERYRSWFDDVPAPGIAVNLQTVRENNNWDSWALPGLYWLAENLPEDLPVLLTGLSRADRIAQAVALFGDRLTLISQNPHQYALHGAVMTANGREDIHARPGDAFAVTVRYMSSLLPRR
jgi:queuine/archaeosine tRNA-ribosyltransferase